MPKNLADWLATTPEPALDPDLPIIDPHHHLWDTHHRRGGRYFLDELLADTADLNVRQTVFIECHAMYRAQGPTHMAPLGETEFVAGVAAQSASGLYGDLRAATAIVGHANLTLGAAVQKVETTKTKAKLTYTLRKDDSEATIDADVVLVATGRKPYTGGLGLDALGVEMTERGHIRTDSRYRTNVPGVLAIGDAIDGPMLAHKAEDEGMAAAETMAGKHGHVNYGVIPGVIYTHPEVAHVGETEETLKAAGRAYKAGRFSFMGNGRAKANFAADGFVKILADKATDRILGAHVVGPMAGDLIHEVCVAMEFGASAEDSALT